MEVLILLGLILLNGLFAMSEIALVTARRARLAKLAENGDVSAAAAIKLGEDPTRFLSTIQIGITSIGVLSGIMGEAALAAPFADWLETLGVSQQVSDNGATIIVVAVVTYCSIVLGELVPKRIGQINPEAIARLVSRPMEGLAFLARPFVILLSISTQTLLRLLGVKHATGPSVTEDEIHAMLEEGSEAGVIEQNEHALLRNVFRLDDRQIASLMIPRSDMIYLDLEDEPAVNLAKVAEADYTRFPVSRGGLSNVLGIVSAKDLLRQTFAGKEIDLAHTPLRPAVFVPETLTGMELLEQIRASGVEMIFVVDEYGEVQGLVTLQDVLEVITGEFMPHDTENAWAVEREDGSLLLDGLIPIPELKDKLELAQVPEEDKGRYHTLSGMMMLLLGRLPHTADIATWENWRLEVVDMDGKRIDKVLATRIVLSSDEPTADEPVTGG
ncbi:hemolysin family protein [Chitiniphilus purpureus]|uniref:Hemolysin family protein n=1 Tax=Chitiniphilus purpureus TaxID=2981137 RepID=A0ABY6DID7_9NEIS|nr:hemolysin family protein [Chitiniphilus sp. CD1]UXY14110.1 hemolysin family protein [Chitiniphilus sp. CD1]